MYSIADSWCGYGEENWEDSSKAAILLSYYEAL